MVRLGSLDQMLGMAMMVAMLGSLFAYAGMVLVGLPANILFGWFRAETGIGYILVGTIALPAAINIQDPLLPTLAQLSWAAIPGAMVAASWWLLASTK